MRTGLLRLTASLVLVTGTAFGCGADGGDGGDGGGEEPPTNASQEEFCGTFGDLLTELGKLGPDAEPAEAVAALKKSGDRLTEIGTPEDIPDDARAGFDLVLEEIEKLDDDATREDISNLGADISEEGDKSMDAYEKYLQDTCADELIGSEPSAPE